MTQADSAHADEPAVRGIIFSRDRAMQLDATLASFCESCEEAEAMRIDILYAATSEKFAEQYRVVERTWRSALRLGFHCECDFRGELLGILGAEGLPARPSLRQAARLLRFLPRPHPSPEAPGAVPRYILFLVDDTIFYRPFSLGPVVAALDAQSRAIGFSLRLGRNTTYCYSLDSRQHVPELEPIGRGAFRLDWTTSECDFGYPLEVSSSIFDIRLITRALVGLEFSNPNTLEGQLAGTTARSWARRSPELLCLEQSVAFSNAVNKVQTVCDNRAGTCVGLSPSELARRFDDGWRIDTSVFKRFTPNGCHCDVPFSFIHAEATARGCPPNA